MRGKIPEHLRRMFNEQANGDFRKNSEVLAHSHNQGWIYLMYAPALQRYKIGRSRRPHKRHKEISAQSPCPIFVIDQLWSVDTKMDEDCWHDDYEDYRVYGEWFQLGNKWADLHLETEPFRLLQRRRLTRPSFTTMFLDAGSTLCVHLGEFEHEDSKGRVNLFDTELIALYDFVRDKEDLLSIESHVNQAIEEIRLFKCWEVETDKIVALIRKQLQRSYDAIYHPDRLSEESELPYFFTGAVRRKLIDNWGNLTDEVKQALAEVA